MTRHLLSVADLDETALRTVLDTAAEMHDVQRREVKKIPTLRGRTVINLFFEDSTRTRSSFEIAGKWMSADTINITGKGSSTSKGESLRDTVRTIAAMGVDAIVMRHQASGAAHQVAGWFDESGVRTSVVNAGDGTHEHPTQALLDAYTLERRLGSLAPGRRGHRRRAADAHAERRERLGERRRLHPGRRPRRGHRLGCRRADDAARAARAHGGRLLPHGS